MYSIMANYKIIKIFEPETGEGTYGPWKSQDVIVEEIDDTVQYPNQILLRLSGKAAENFNLQVGDEVTFMYSTRVSVFTVKKDTPDEKEMGRMECKCWKIEKVKPSDNLPFS